MIGNVSTSQETRIEQLGNISTFLGGGTPSKRNPTFWDGDIPWVSPKDMKSEVISTSIDKITSEAIEGSAAKIVPVNSILVVVRSGILARTIPIGITGTELTINQDLKAIVPAPSIDYRYLSYYLRASEPELLASVSKGATVHRLSTDSLKSLSIPVPPIDEQKRIVAALDQAYAALDRARAHVEANLADIEELRRQATTRNLTPCKTKDGWTTTTLGDCVSISGGFAFRSANYVDAGHFLIRIANVQDGKISLHRPKYVQLDSRTRKYELAAGDILTSLTGNIGRVAEISDAHLPAALNQRVAKITPYSAAVNRDYVLQFLKSELFRDPLRSKGRGAAQQNVSPNEIRNVVFRFPPIGTQRQIVAKNNSLDAHCAELSSNYRAALKETATLRQSLLNYAFSGQLI